MLGVNGALVRVNVPRSVGTLREVLHHGVAVHLSAAVAGTQRVCVRDTRRVDVAFVGVVEATEEVLGIKKRMQLCSLCHRDHFQTHA